MMMMTMNGRGCGVAVLAQRARRALGLGSCRRHAHAASASGDSRKVYVGGAGVVPVTRQQDVTLEQMGAQAVRAALADADMDPKSVQAVFVGNMMSGMLSKQQHLGPLIANAAGLDLVEASTTEACCGAGGAALRMAYLAVMSGELETVAVVGTELMTHADRETITEALATASHWATEGAKGETFVSLNGKLMAEYMRRYNVPHAKFFPFAQVAHNNAMTAAHAVFPDKPLTLDMYENAPVVTDPIQLFDASPTCDGAACVLLTSNPSLAARAGGKRVRVASSAAATDILAVAMREDPLHLRAVEKSAMDAMSRAGVTHADIDIFELHDAYTSMACLALENAGFVPHGEGVEFAADGHISLDGQLPIATFGGLKARGHPVGATGVYQAAEMFMQLNGTAGMNQVPNTEILLEGE
ncbi:hypothetical protein PTSG_11735 [Salpingoeca rosetta]|uniref:Acetyl-CoA acetyltransferase n=1 Tax=Salpingoeca rosetta (strain ATCC 50818 / BSB-021) TaxID=946362 RepID=F2U0E4_SALR5|nr:uncharacterized protein PTSG_11735 [Salpingoeca rosetta]EGD80872.1 hypothetical protein PTSG_11735 [Salpingoeca rosetta]|eukprot:XP_004997433.1 hypothetical protein PTSG_11735 [Salpingoeca rosetta]